MIWLLGIGLGFAHAFDPDHLAAVSTFVSHKPGRRKSLRFALEWGAGHSLSLLVLTVVVLFLGKSVGAWAEKALESAVGVALIGLGVWRMVDYLQGKARIHSHAHADDPSHEHFHAHPTGDGQDDHDHSHVAGFVGILHGAAGSARFLVLIPVALIGSWSGCLGYVLFFCVGVTVAMMMYAVSLGHLFEKSQNRFALLQNVYQPLTALISFGLGVYWVVSNL